ncbi:hypothetical protein C5167_035117 [Papaver somniferum]|uniref:tRNA pseudouridine synthase n=1 Tax=Papaver somniferum TaxID=3469 RepID=A0A4Y7KIS1_PAPSO|nr:uncharacterized protein LOC113300005 [Papaver somniferum]RZC71958.1 hypothetical protein C5167_035117 [Papaver somniferum]
MLKFARVTVNATAKEPIWSYKVMEKQTDSSTYLHYNHTDSCKDSRWTARECYEFMYDKRPWQKVHNFYLNLVNGRLPIQSLFGTERYSAEDASVQFAAKSLETCEEGVELEDGKNKNKKGRWARATYKIVLSYHGDSFDGWQKQPGLNAVQSVVERSIGSFIDEFKAQKLKDKSLPLEACVAVAGRTDKGVTALNQVCSFFTWRNDIKTQDVEDAINSASPGKLRVVSASKVSRDFHPNFSAKWRRYFYIFPIIDLENEGIGSGKNDENSSSKEKHSDLKNGCLNVEEKDECLAVDAQNGVECRNKPRSFSVKRVNELLLQLEGKSLSYRMFARDIKASRSTGPPTECFIYHARATEARLPSIEEVYGNDDRGQKVMCVELIGNRFLRRMVRVLVATTIREAAAGADDEALLNLMEATCRRATAPPAPPDGLCLLDVGYEEFNPENTLIQ